MTLVVLPILILLGTVGLIVYGVIVAVCLVLGANARLKNIGAEELRESSPIGAMKKHSRSKLIAIPADSNR